MEESSNDILEWYIDHQLDLPLLRQRLDDCSRALVKYVEISSKEEGSPILKAIYKLKDLNKECPNPPPYIKKHLDNLDNITYQFYGYHIENFNIPANYSNEQLFKIFDQRMTTNKDTPKQSLNASSINKPLRTLIENFNKVKFCLEECKNDKQSLFALSHLCQLLFFATIFYKDMTRDQKIQFLIIEQSLRSQANEAIGYWTAKIEQIKTADKSNATIKEKRKIKEQHVTDVFLKLRNANREALEGLSQNQIAKRIQEKAIDTLKHKTTKTGVLVLKRNIGKDGNIKYSGLDIDTVIDIMKKTDRFKLFNPFKPKTA